MVTVKRKVIQRHVRCICPLIRLIRLSVLTAIPDHRLRRAMFAVRIVTRDVFWSGLEEEVEDLVIDQGFDDLAGSTTYMVRQCVRGDYLLQRLLSLLA